MGRPRWGALPRPTARPWGVRPAPATHCLFVRGVWAWERATNPTARTLASRHCALWSGTRETLGGGAFCLRVGRPRLGTLPRPTGRLWGVRPGCATQRLLVRGVWAWRSVTNPTARTLASRLCAVWGGTRAPGGGGAPLACVWNVRGWALSLARPLVLVACSRGLVPTRCGCGGGGGGDQSPTRQGALLPAGFVRCGGSTRAPREGASCLRVGRPGVGRSPLPDRPSLGRAAGPATHWLSLRGMWVCGPVTNPTACALASWLCALWGQQEGARGGCLLPAYGPSGPARSPTLDCPSLARVAGNRYPLAWGAGAVGVGTRHLPHSARSCELPLRAVGAARRVTGGAPLACAWGVRGWAPSPARPPILGACGRARYPLAVGAAGVGVGTPHLTRSARSCELPLRALGGARGRPGGAPLACMWGVRGGALPQARPLVLGACGRGPLPTGCGCWGGARRDPSPAPLCALLRAGFARCGDGTKAPGGGASCLPVGRPGSGALPRPTARPWGVRPGPATHWLWVWCAGVGARLSLAPSPVQLFVVCGARFPGLRHPAAVVVWHLSLCLGCGRRRASLACLMAPRWCAALRPVRSLSVLRLTFPTPWCLSTTRGLAPPASVAGCAGHAEAGRDLGSLCLLLATSMSYPFGAPRWGCS